MTPFKVFKTVLTNFISNFRSMFKYNNEQDCIRVIQTQNQILSNHIFSIRKEIIELYFDTHKNEAIQYQDELVYLKKLKKMTPFLYPQIKQIEAPISGFDK